MDIPQEALYKEGTRLLYHFQRFLKVCKDKKIHQNLTNTLWKLLRFMCNDQFLQIEELSNRHLCRYQ